MREIEVKARVANEQMLLRAARQLGIAFDGAIEQRDTTYESALPYEHPEWNIFRLRQQGDITILTMKHKASDRSRDNYEYETVVENAKEATKMLARLHYKKGVEVHKHRKIAHYQNMEICLDAIDRLGLFIEVEELAGAAADVDAIQNKLWQFLRSLGVRDEDRVYKGYDTLMRHHLAGTSI